jgi:hypothetical protein
MRRKHASALAKQHRLGETRDPDYSIPEKRPPTDEEIYGPDLNGLDSEGYGADGYNARGLNRMGRDRDGHYEE